MLLDATDVIAMTGPPGDSPAVARQRVRREVRRGRLSSGLTQTEVAQSLGWSLSKVQRIESGEVAVSETDLRALLSLLGVGDAGYVAELVAQARVSRRQRWWTAPEYRKHLTPGLVQLLQFETVATAIRVYQPLLVPGVMQTPEMIDYILNAFGTHLSAEERRVRYDVRLLRRKQVIEREDGPDYLLALDESALERGLGGTEVMAAQLEALAAVAHRPNIHVRLVPLEKGVDLGLLGPFTLLDLSDDDAEDSVLYREQYQGDELNHHQDVVGAYRRHFEEAWSQCFDEEASLRRISAKAAVLRSSLDRP